MAFTIQNSLDLAGRLGSDPGRRDDVGLPSATGDASPPRTRSISMSGPGTSLDHLSWSLCLSFSREKTKR